MREEMEASLEEPKYQHDGEDFYVGICRAEEILDEAEQKWEEDVCEWKIFDNSLDDERAIWVYATDCEHYLEEEKTTKAFKYCPYCGKKIKVVE